MTLTDQHGRRKRKLRLSLTDRCNFRCTYCLPEHPVWLAKETLLTDAERFRLVRLMVTTLGISELRLTGGEPLLRRDLEARTAELNALRGGGLERIALTSNGYGLAARAKALKAAGVDSINVSLDAVTAAGFARLTGSKYAVSAVQEGVIAAQQAGLAPKLNAVILRGQNEDEILPLAHWAAAQQVPLRLIEFMPLDGSAHWQHSVVVTEAEMLERLAEQFAIAPEPETSEPARYYQLTSERGTSLRLGMISTISRPFCSRCDRLRLTADGQLYTCLFSPQGLDLRGLLRAAADDAALTAAIRHAVFHKQAGYAATGYVERPITMHGLGG
jgi:cyclic pyranopterin phosphate synthase